MRRSLIAQPRGGWRQWDAYARSFYEAAEALVIAASGPDGPRPRDIGKPVILLYRQYLELRLKEIFSLSGHVLGEPTKPPWNHRLPPLWTEDQRRLAFLGSAFAVTPEQIDAAIEEFEKLDPSGDAARFPYDRRGRWLPLVSEPVDLERLRTIVERAATGLDRLALGLQTLIERKAEAEAERSADHPEEC